MWPVPAGDRSRGLLARPAIRPGATTKTRAHPGCSVYTTPGGVVIWEQLLILVNKEGNRSWEKFLRMILWSGHFWPGW
ncbi:hypothetical protein SAMN02745218_01360 [Desulfofundulus australicus DSM 11792]|uniref:Uncharacterized protein n=1 Tax=Desulfofundulus australicus DSM 11792 TaxID=1121425 RepID=A0A1M4YKI2_9FIRM|nr:hypothetical protein SAMN02745218_01360 [Desulfofundulus australicus DSM 11792]